MAFDNVRGIVRIGSPFSVGKMLLLAASVSRPQLRPICLALLRPFVRDGGVEIEYACGNQRLKCLIRLSDVENDCYTFYELALRDCYQLDPEFEPDLVVDAGSNIGLFSLWATGLMRSRNRAQCEIAIVEPMPRNLQQIRKHLGLNAIEAEIFPGCLGGTPSVIPFYVRGSIDSSFDPAKPYQSVSEMRVYTLDEVIKEGDSRRILIKLDIEGMEIAVLDHFVPRATGPVYLVGELHYAEKNASALEALFERHRWAFEYLETDGLHRTFRACSPAAMPLLAWVSSMPKTVPEPRPVALAQGL